MADSTYPPGRPLTVSEVLDLTFSIYRSTLFNCMLLAAIGVLCGQLAAIYSIARGRHLPSGAQGMQALLAQLHDPALGIVALLYLVGAVLSLVFYGAVLLRQRALLTSQPTGGEIGSALRRVPAVIVLGVLVLLTLLACFVPAAVLFWPPTGAGLGTRLLAVLAGLAALSYVMIAISCAWTVLYVDGAGAVDSFLRSWRLTSGNFWRLSVVYTIALIVLFAVDALIVGVAGFMGALMGHADVAVVGALIGVVSVALGAFVTPFYTALGLAVFGDLSVRREGTDLERRIAAA
jgi:hypothetical protein